MPRVLPFRQVRRQARDRNLNGQKGPGGGGCWEEERTHLSPAPVLPCAEKTASGAGGVLPTFTVHEADRSPRLLPVPDVVPPKSDTEEDAALPAGSRAETRPLSWFSLWKPHLCARESFCLVLFATRRLLKPRPCAMEYPRGGSVHSCVPRGPFRTVSLRDAPEAGSSGTECARLSVGGRRRLEITHLA
ncbi:hypothetical protein P7K49_009042 [Saguinus oedipus]|uniref:Uncharacterized protein n=1 Tax=Saguinus oedipus TaxID=9490 RepID=A0ABQ9VZH0_SAGOE|nr:hypothetical protein P7K49_009042 [Saguinus oedipus]